eukprot:20090-Heterococcus_DN1.PRE.4
MTTRNYLPHPLTQQAAAHDESCSATFMRTSCEEPAYFEPNNAQLVRCILHCSTKLDSMLKLSATDPALKVLRGVLSLAEKAIKVRTVRYSIQLCMQAMHMRSALVSAVVDAHFKQLCTVLHRGHAPGAETWQDALRDGTLYMCMRCLCLRTFVRRSHDAAYARYSIQHKCILATSIDRKRLAYQKAFMQPVTPLQTCCSHRYGAVAFFLVWGAANLSMGRLTDAYNAKKYTDFTASMDVTETLRCEFAFYELQLGDAVADASRSA